MSAMDNLSRAHDDFFSALNDLAKKYRNASDEEKERIIARLKVPNSEPLTPNKKRDVFEEQMDIIPLVIFIMLIVVLIIFLIVTGGIQ